jgi:hypothetical protein
MDRRLAAFTVVLLSAAGCSTVPQIPKSDYVHAIVGSWHYAATHSGENIQKDLIVVFHADGRVGVRSLGRYGFLEEYISGERWRIDGDRLMLSGSGGRSLGGEPTTDRIVSFTADEIIAISESVGEKKDSVIEQATRTYKRIQQQRSTPNQTMQRTPTRRSPKISHD